MFVQSVTKPQLIKGLPTSAGISMGQLTYFGDCTQGINNKRIKESSYSALKKMYQAIMSEAHKEMKQRLVRFKRESSKEGVSLVESHIELLNDPELMEAIDSNLRATRSLNSALLNVLQSWQFRFFSVPDPVFRDRFYDFQDVIRRLMELANHKRKKQWYDRTIVYSEDGLPSCIIEVPSQQLSGVISCRGNSGSHISIMARAQAVPCVSHVFLSPQVLQEGSEIIIDGNRGWVIIHPDEQILDEYRKKSLRAKDKIRVSTAKPVEPKLKDGTQIKVQANIDQLTDLKTLKESGSEGVGLLRSEYLILCNRSIPSIQQQYEFYKEVVQAQEGKITTIRLFDLGSDKPVIDTWLQNELNPSLGCRGIRLLLREKLLLRQQLEAILKVSKLGPVRILVPMVTQENELIALRVIVQEVLEGLNDPQISFPQIGSMIEVPAAVLTLDRLANYSDFFSLGSNDLIQYVCAADRCNSELYELYNPLNLGVLRLIQRAVELSKLCKKEISICGEMGVDSRCIPVLIGLGLRQFSMSPVYIPLFKQQLQDLELQSLEEQVSQLLQHEIESLPK